MPQNLTCHIVQHNAREIALGKLVVYCDLLDVVAKMINIYILPLEHILVSIALINGPVLVNIAFNEFKIELEMGCNMEYTVFCGMGGKKKRQCTKG